RGIRKDSPIPSKTAAASPSVPTTATSRRSGPARRRIRRAVVLSITSDGILLPVEGPDPCPPLGLVYPCPAFTRAAPAAKERDRFIVNDLDCGRARRCC